MILCHPVNLQLLTMSIIALDENTAKKISTAQIITSVSTVVKELVENALDASSNSVDIILERKGLTYIEVRDNGEGISSTDATFMALPSYTSKLSSFSDLESINTYGFRGEALNAICRLADVKIITRTAEDNAARLYRLGLNGKVEQAELTHRSIGTTVRVEGLFSKIPVRRKTISNEKFINDDMNKLENLLKDFGFCYPRLKLNFKVDGKVILTKTFGNTLKDNLINIYGAKFTSFYEFLTVEESDLVVNLIIPKTNVDDFSNICQSNYSHIIINNRPITCKDLEKLISNLISEHFESKLPNNKKPTFFLTLKMPQSEVDINLEPNKTKILFKDSSKINKTIKKLIENYYEILNCSNTSSSNINQTIDSSASYPNILDNSDTEEPALKKRKKSSKLSSPSKNIKKSVNNNNDDGDGESHSENKENKTENYKDEGFNQMPIVDLGDDFSTQEINAIPVLNPDQVKSVMCKIEEFSNSTQINDKEETDIPNDFVFSDDEEFTAERIGGKQDSVLNDLKKGLSEGSIQISNEDWSKGHCSLLKGGTSIQISNANIILNKEDIKRDPKIVNAQGFQKFSNEIRTKIVKENPGINLVEIAKSISRRWKELTPEERQIYREAAIQEADAKAAFANLRKSNSSGQSQIKENSISPIVREKNKKRLLTLLNKRMKEIPKHDNLQKKTIILWEIDNHLIKKKSTNNNNNNKKISIVGKLNNNIWLVKTNNQIWALDSIQLFNGLKIKEVERKQNKETIEKYLQQWKDDMNLLRFVYHLKI